MFRIALTDFRCFAATPSLEVLPITFLVGENSTGKTTFLAAIRQLLENFSRSASQNPFNRDPYFLGGFDQIARNRGGRGGRAKAFSLELQIPATAETVQPPPRIPRQTTSTNHKFTFTKGSPQPELSEYRFKTRDASVVLTLADKPMLAVSSDSFVQSIELDIKRLPPAPLLRRDISFLRFIFDDIIFGMKKQREENQNLDALMRQFSQSLNFSSTRRIFASSPVRTQPLRTYTPSEIASSSEGSHVPLEMAQRKINAPEEWERLHRSLATFGQEAGLFEDIDIRLLGKRDGDPFQVLVKTKGPPVNLVDVGYGVSQALPIVYQLEQSRTHDVYLLQQPEVHLHPRAQAAIGTLIARRSKERPGNLYVVETHSDFIIDRVRTEVASGNIDHRSVTIIFFERTDHDVFVRNIYLNDKGEISYPPPTFRSFFLQEHARLLGL